MQPEEIQKNRVYRGKKPCQAGAGYVNDRQVIWIGNNQVQYDSPSIATGNKFRSMSLDDFARWAHKDVTDELYALADDHRGWVIWEDYLRRKRDSVEGQFNLSQYQVYDARYGDCEVFRPHEMWESPKGTVYRVVCLFKDDNGDSKALLRKGSFGSSKRMVRDFDAVIGWVRIHSPAEKHFLNKSDPSVAIR